MDTKHPFLVSDLEIHFKSRKIVDKSKSLGLNASLSVVPEINYESSELLQIPLISDINCLNSNYDVSYNVSFTSLSNFYYLFNFYSFLYLPDIFKICLILSIFFSYKIFVVYFVILFFTLNKSDSNNKSKSRVLEIYILSVIIGSFLNSFAKFNESYIFFKIESWIGNIKYINDNFGKVTKVESNEQIRYLVF